MSFRVVNFTDGGLEEELRSVRLSGDEPGIKRMGGEECAREGELDNDLVEEEERLFDFTTGMPFMVAL